MNNSDLIKTLIEENIARKQELEQEIREVTSNTFDLLKKWIVSFQEDNKIKLSVGERSISYYDSQEFWEFPADCSDEQRLEVAIMDDWAEKFGWDLKSICKRIKK